MATTIAHGFRDVSVYKTRLYDEEDEEEEEEEEVCGVSQRQMYAV